MKHIIFMATKFMKESFIDLVLFQKLQLKTILHRLQLETCGVTEQYPRKHSDCMVCNITKFMKLSILMICVNKSVLNQTNVWSQSFTQKCYVLEHVNIITCWYTFIQVCQHKYIVSKTITIGVVIYVSNIL